MEEKNYEAIVEAILFTMGESVELEKIAAALELDKKETKKIIENLMKEYEKPSIGMKIIELTSVLGYELKTAVGTSVFIMTFTALTGALSHFAIGGTPDLVVLILCIVSTLIFARVAAVLANKAPAKLLNQATGVILVILGAAIIAVQYVF